jgi:hypothetical protein
MLSMYTYITSKYMLCFDRGWSSTDEENPGYGDDDARVMSYEL